MFGFFNKESGYENVGADTFQQLVESNPKAVVLDVRTAREFGSGHLPKAKLKDFYQNFKNQVESLPRGEKYLLYCRSGARSANACKLMHRMGFTDLTNLRGGILAWKGAVAR